MGRRDGEKRYWLDDPKNVDKVVYTLYAVCGLLLLADFFYHKHVHFSFENWIGFYGLYGFFGSVLLVLLAKQLRKLVMRSEDYYDAPEEYPVESTDASAEGGNV